MLKFSRSLGYADDFKIAVPFFGIEKKPSISYDNAAE